MRLSEAITLHEARFSSPVEMYHGTSSNHLRSILSQGLSPEHSGGYGSDVGGRVNQRDMTAIGGVYLTTSLRTAQSAASSSGGGDLIVVVSVQPKSGYADEDDIDMLISSAIGRQSPKEQLTRYAMMKYQGANYSDEVISRLPESVVGLLDRQGDKETIVRRVHMAYLARSLSYSLRDSGSFLGNPAYILADVLGIRDDIEETFDELLEDIGTPQEAETAYREVLERLSIMLKRYSYDSDINPMALNSGPLGGSIRMEEGIGFRGNNKITAIIEVDEEARSFDVYYVRQDISPVIDQLSNQYGDYDVEDRRGMG